MTTSIDSGRQGDLLDVPLEQFHVGGAGLGDVAPGQGEHLIGHVQPEDPTRGSDPLPGQQHIDATARAEVQDPLPLLEVSDRDGVAAAK